MKIRPPSLFTFWHYPFYVQILFLLKKGNYDRFLGRCIMSRGRPFVVPFVSIRFETLSLLTWNWKKRTPFPCWSLEIYSFEKKIYHVSNWSKKTTTFLVSGVTRYGDKLKGKPLHCRPILVDLSRRSEIDYCSGTFMGTLVKVRLECPFVVRPHPRTPHW